MTGHLTHPVGMKQDVVSPSSPAQLFAPAIGARSPYEVDPGDLWRTLWRRRWTTVGSAFLGLLLGVVVALASTPTFTSEARMMLDNRRNAVLDTPLLSRMELTGEMVETEVEVVSSRTINARASEALDLPTLLEARRKEAKAYSLTRTWQTQTSKWFKANSDMLLHFLPPAWVASLTADPLIDDEPIDHEAAIRFLSEHVRARQAGNTSIVVIQASDQDADVAAAIVNAVADAYLASQLEWKRAETSGANEYLRSRIADLHEEIAGKRAQLEQLRSASGEISEYAGSLLAQGRLLSNEQLRMARSDRIKLASNLEQLDAIIGDRDPAIVARMVVTPLMEQLRSDQSAIRQELAQLSTTYGARHPRLVDATQRLEQIERNIQSEAERHRSMVATEFRAMQREEALLEADLAAQNEQDKALNEDRSAAAALRSEIATTQELLDVYLTRFKEADEQQHVLRPDARVISEAVPNDYADFPNRKIIVAGTVAMFGLLGIIIAFVRDSADRSLRSLGDTEDALRVPVLGVIPELPKQSRKLGPIEFVARKPGSAFSESVRKVVTSIGLRPHTGRGPVLLVTSALPGEGKSSVSSIIAHQVARAGWSCLLLEADLRKPRLAQNLGCLPTPGIIHLIRGEVSFEQTVQHSERYGMDLIAAGGTTDDSLYMLQSKEMQSLLDHAASLYDLIIIDSPPVVALPDAQVLTKYAASVLFLCRWGRTPRETASSGIRMLVRQGGAPVMAALSHVDMKRYASYDDTYADPSIERYYAH